MNAIRNATPQEIERLRVHYFNVLRALRKSNPEAVASVYALLDGFTELAQKQSPEVVSITVTLLAGSLALRLTGTPIPTQADLDADDAKKAKDTNANN